MSGTGDRTYKKVKITIDGTDITDTWHVIDIFQSIDAMSWSCSIGIIDGTNMLENLPILHGSELKILIETQDQCSTDDSVEFIFYIYKIADKRSANQNVETFTLHGVTRAFLENNTIRINDKYESNKLTDIIADISKKSFPSMSVTISTPSDNSNDVVINNWSPFISISWLLKQAHRDNRADFMFFQSDINEFKIDSIESMYSSGKNKLGEIISYKIENLGDHNTYNIIKHHWEHVDVQQNLQNGYYKSTVTTYDFMNKNWAESIYSHGDDNAADKSVAPQWKDSLFGNAEKAVISFTPKVPNIFNNATSYDDSDKWVPSRRAVLQRLDSEKFSAQLRGSVGTYRWLGKHIYIDLPNNDEQSNEFYSRFRRGYYLISAVVHHITPSMYVNNYEFVKMRVES